MNDEIMIQDSIHICPNCGGIMRKILTEKDMVFVCLDKRCKTVLTVVGKGQSERELKCDLS